MLRIGLIRERKKLPDERVALTPQQCRLIMDKYPGIHITVEPSPTRCYPDAAYEAEGITLSADMTRCDVLMGIKEVPAEYLIPGKTYFFFSHTRKKQPHNKGLMNALIDKHVRMIDYECLTHADEQRILGFGMFAGIVGAHNGLLAYGRKSGLYQLPAAHAVGTYDDMIRAYDAVKLPNIKIVMTGSGRVASGVLDVMRRLDIEEVEPTDFITHQYDYPVFTHLKGASLYARKDNGLFHRDDFHANPGAYKCLFSNYVNQADILMNGIYWEERIARLFEKEDIRRRDWRISVIADISCDVDGSVPITLDSTTIANPVFGVDRQTLAMTEPYRKGNETIDVMAVDNLPNELPRDAAQYFGVHFEKHVLPELLKENSDILRRATICEDGKLTPRFEYLSDYAYTHEETEH
jgi:alanine dehydrogenase